MGANTYIYTTSNNSVICMPVIQMHACMHIAIFCMHAHMQLYTVYKYIICYCKYVITFYHLVKFTVSYTDSTRVSHGRKSERRLREIR